jgi:hypothetical protein
MAIAVHPITDSGHESDSWSLSHTLRVRVLHVANGLPLRFALADQPEIDDKMQRILDKRSSHPFVFASSKKPEVILKWENKEHSFELPNLRTYTELPYVSKMPESLLEETWTRVPEIFDALPDSSVLKGPNEAFFVQVRSLGVDLTHRYVLVKDANGVYAKHRLATSFEGILEIPVRTLDWIKGASIKIQLRDYMLLEAVGEFSPEKLEEAEQMARGRSSINGAEALTVRLDKGPNDFKWWAKVGSSKRDFVDVISLRPSRIRLGSFDSTVWAVRRTVHAKNETGNTFNGFIAGIQTNPAPDKRKGICIHFNSGYWHQEKRQNAFVDCLDAVAKQENTFPLDLIVALKTVAEEKKGYNYHIDRQGTIVLADEEKKVMSHAPPAREMTPVTANLPDGTSKTENIASPETAINTNYLGVALIGDDGGGGKKDGSVYYVTAHEGKREHFYFTPVQLWYLDRLIENLRQRHSVTWPHIQGHDEVRKAYNDANPLSPAEGKPDPGYALKGGMGELRGRHTKDIPL